MFCSFGRLRAQHIASKTADSSNADGLRYYFEVFCASVLSKTFNFYVLSNSSTAAYCVLRKFLWQAISILIDCDVLSG